MSKVADDTVRTPPHSSDPANISAETSPARDPAHQKEDGGERPVREKLRDASIQEQLKDGKPREKDEDTARAKDPEDTAHDGAKDRGRNLRRKRSWDEADPEAPTENAEGGVAKHSRKRSRSADKLDDDLGMTEKQATDVNEETDPSKKPAQSPTKAISTTAEAAAIHDSGTTMSGESKPPADSTLPPNSGFANVSATSPFASLSNAPTNKTIQAGGGFASSGFSSFSSSAKSPFANFASSKPPEESTNANGETKSTQAPKLSFTSNASSAFGSGTTTLSNLGGNFSSGGGFGGFGATTSGGLTSFASTTGANGFGSKISKPFGAPVDEDGDDNKDSEDEDEIAESERGALSPTSAEEKDERFYERDIETGEEQEITLFNSRAKLYVNQDKQWKERGVGVFKLNMSDAGDTEAKSQARFIMRTDGSQKMVLNSPLTKDVEVKDRMGGPPNSKSVTFLAFLDGQPAPCLLMMRSLEQCQELAAAVKRAASSF